MIKVCIPYYSDHKATDAGVKELEASGLPCKIEYAQGPLVAEARNALVNRQKSDLIYQDVTGEFSHFLFVDSDIGFSLAHVMACLAADKEIIGLPYLRHNYRTQYHAGTFAEPGVIASRFSTSEKGLRDVDWIGAGFLLVRSDVLSGLCFPWFRYGVIEKDGHASNVGEDICFCMAAREAGLKIWCDFNNPVYHAPRKVNYDL